MKNLTKFSFPVFALLMSLLMVRCNNEKQQVEPKNKNNKTDASAWVVCSSKLDQPTITCDQSTLTTIGIKVCAGQSGAPAGFTIEWMKKSDFVANNNQFPPSSDSRVCRATFSSPLTSNQCRTITIGNLPANCNTQCSGPLKCGTEYVFRAYVNASGNQCKSDYSCNSTPCSSCHTICGPLTCSTLPCQPCHCVYTQGYWKNHGPNASGNNSNVWKVNSLTLGNVSYSAEQLVSILRTPPKGNGLIILAHQLIAAQLNIANGACANDQVTQAIVNANASIGNNNILNGGYLSPNQVSSLNDILTNFNEGKTAGAPHCGD